MALNKREVSVRSKRKRAATVRKPLRNSVRELEIRDREGHRTKSQGYDELADWESETVWPPDYPLL